MVNHDVTIHNKEVHVDMTIVKDDFDLNPKDEGTASKKDPPSSGATDPHCVTENKKHILGTKAEIDAALERLAASSKSFGFRSPPRESAMCYSMDLPREVDTVCKCDTCRSYFTMKVYEREEDLIRRYRALAKKFEALGHRAEIIVSCKDCAQRLYPSPSSRTIHHIVFSFTAAGSNVPVLSYPAQHEYYATPYKTALCFLNGFETLSQISEETHTYYSPSIYLSHIEEVLGIKPT
jgi:hypothetical protein